MTVLTSYYFNVTTWTIIAIRNYIENNIMYSFYNTILIDLNKSNNILTIVIYVALNIII